MNHPAASSPPTPANIEAERSVLGAILIQNDTLQRTASVIQPGDFFRDAHKRIYWRMCQLAERGSAIDLVTLNHELGVAGELEDVGGPAYLAALLDGVPRSTNAEHYARIVKQAATARQLGVVLREALDVVFADPASLGNGVGGRLQEQVCRIVDDARSTVDSVRADGCVSLQQLAERLVDAPRRRRVLGELLALEEIAMLHGQPRDGKTWASLEFVLSVATGRRAFGLEHLTTDVPLACLIVSNEDSEAAYLSRFNLLLAGQCVFDYPQNIHLLVGRGCNLDDMVWQTRLLAECKRLDVKLIVLDPLRSLTAAADQGPRELQPFAQFLRHLIRETGACVLLVHHDTKPSAIPSQDQRRRAQRASGGGLFSIVDAPMHVERLDDRRSLVAPDGFKHCDDPSAFVFSRVDQDGVIQLAGESVGNATASTAVALRAKVIDFVRDNPRSSVRSIASGVHANRDTVKTLLVDLQKHRKAEVVIGPRKAELWSLYEEGISATNPRASRIGTTGAGSGSPS